MTKYVCDRCGTDLPDQDIPYRVELTCTDPRGRSRPHPTLDVSDIDLCPRCVTAVARFVKRYHAPASPVTEPVSEPKSFRQINKYNQYEVLTPEYIEKFRNCGKDFEEGTVLILDLFSAYHELGGKGGTAVFYERDRILVVRTDGKTELEKVIDAAADSMWHGYFWQMSTRTGIHVFATEYSPRLREIIAEVVSV